MVLEPDGQFGFQTVPNVLAVFQKLVGGYVEAVRIPGVSTGMTDSVIALVDEEGTLKPEPQYNMFSEVLQLHCVGTIVLLHSTADGDFASLTDLDMQLLMHRFDIHMRWMERLEQEGG